MTDGPDTPESSTPAIAEVRRLLAEARHTEPMPDDVAARLDDVLAGLTQGSPRADVVPLEGRRRRRAAQWLVAAAAVVVGGFVAVPHLHLDSTNSSQATDASGATSHEFGAQDTGKSPHRSDSTRPGAAPRLDLGRVVIRPHRFAADARAVRRELLDGVQALATLPSTCRDVPPGAGSVPAEYGHTDAVLVFKEPLAGSQVVELYVCGRADPIRSATLPVP